MRIGLSMVVKDEAARIEDCLADIVDLFEEAVFFDTGSTDGTPEIIESITGIKPVPYLDPKGDGLYLPRVRNESYTLLGTPWILTLDADERIEPSHVGSILRMEDDPSVSGYFCAWMTRGPEGETIEDYKLPLVRRGIEHDGLSHANFQHCIRRRGQRAAWTDAFRIDHQPEWARAGRKDATYLERITLAIERDPDWLRYHWFLGYLHYRRGGEETARGHLERAARSRSEEFPVECLNSHMILAEMHARRGERKETSEWLEAALSFLEQVGEDFEVRVNFRLEPWLLRARDACESGRLDDIRAYRFPY
jgi:glycosyltransferase involved in cell wall biosynthesis